MLTPYHSWSALQRWTADILASQPTEYSEVQHSPTKPRWTTSAKQASMCLVEQLYAAALTENGAAKCRRAFDSNAHSWTLRVMVLSSISIDSSVVTPRWRVTLDFNQAIPKRQWCTAMLGRSGAVLCLCAQVRSEMRRDNHFRYMCTNAHLSTSIVQTCRLDKKKRGSHHEYMHKIRILWYRGIKLLETSLSGGSASAGDLWRPRRHPLLHHREITSIHAVDSSIKHDSDFVQASKSYFTVGLVYSLGLKLSRWRHWMPVWSSLIPEKHGADTEWLRRWPRVRAVSFPVTPTCARALRRWSMVYHRILFSNDPAFKLIGLSWSLMRSLNQVQERNRGELAAVNQENTARIRGSRFPFLSFSLCCGSFFKERSVQNGCCWARLQQTRTSSCHQDVAWCGRWEYARVQWVFRVCKATINRVRNRLQAAGTIETKVGSGSIHHLSGVAIDAILMHDIVQTAQQTEAVHPLPDPWPHRGRARWGSIEDGVSSAA